MKPTTRPDQGSRGVDIKTEVMTASKTVIPVVLTIPIMNAAVEYSTVILRKQSSRLSPPSNTLKPG
ncbi:MAG: hypothetical protein J7L11_09925 [Thermoprotei archaeon]|nr:hypothetical protein [Thermoprotei archaeon]